MFDYSGISKKVLKFLIIWIAFTSCATSGVRVESRTKGAVLYLYDAGTKKEHKIGYTPKIISQKILKKASGPANFTVLKLDKFGYLPAYIFVPSGWKFSGKLNVALTRVDSTYFKQLSKQDYIERISKIIFEFLKIQSYIESGKLEAAKKTIDFVEKEYGDIPPLQVLKGNYYLSIKDYPTALLSYKRAYRLYPRDEEIRKAILFLESKKSER